MYMSDSFTLRGEFSATLLRAASAKYRSFDACCLSDRMMDGETGYSGAGLHFAPSNSYPA